MWGAQEKSEGHIKKFAAGALRRHCAPHLQIASDATAVTLVYCTQTAPALPNLGVPFC